MVRVSARGFFTEIENIELMESAIPFKSVGKETVDNRDPSVLENFYFVTPTLRTGKCG